MKILLSAYACEPDRGSERGIGWNWALALASLGHEVWTLTRPEGRSAIEAHLATLPEPRPRIVYVDTPAWTRHVLKGQFGVYAQYFLWQRTAHGTALRLDAALDFDVVHHVSWGSLHGGSWLWRLNKPFVFGPVGGGQVAPAGFERYFLDRARAEAVRTAVTRHVLPDLPFLRRMLRHTSLVLAANRETLALAQHMGAPRARLFLDTGLPAQCFTEADPKRPNGPLKVLWVGGLIPRKGLRLALEALHDIDIPFRLTILGDGPLAARIPEWTREFDLEDQVEWRGWVPWSDVQQAYRAHDVFLFTSLRDTFGSQLLEAMANGLPIVTLDHHGAHDLVPEEAALKVPVTTPPDTIQGIARALRTLHAEPDLCCAMGQAGRAFARTQEWSVRASAITKLYASLTPKALRPRPLFLDAEVAVDGEQ